LTALHGYTGTPEYRAWSGLKQRCLNPDNKNWEAWGGRGITVFPGWVHDFPAFLAHVGPRPGAGYSLDRIDVDGNYEPGNVRWANVGMQNNNRRTVANLQTRVGELEAQLRRAWQQEERDAIEEAENNPT
jgi:hypothetical protein